MSVLVVDLVVHRRDCTRCRPLKLCPVGIRIMMDANEAIGDLPRASKRWGAA